MPRRSRGLPDFNDERGAVGSASRAVGGRRGSVEGRGAKQDLVDSYADLVWDDDDSIPSVAEAACLSTRSRTLTWAGGLAALAVLAVLVAIIVDSDT